MSDEENKCTALVKYEPLTLAERLELRAELKRRELEEALEQGRVRDPISIGISIAISVGLSLASAGIAKLLAPKPKMPRRGEMSGEVQGLMRSEQGILRPEIYGADPGDGKGGVKAPCFIFWSSKIRKTTHVESTPTGGGKGFGGPKTTDVEVVEYDLDFAAGGGRGPLRLKEVWANSDKLIDLDERGVYEGEDASNTFTAPYIINDDETASDGKEVTLQGAGGATSAVQFNAIVSNGAATRDLTVYYVNTGTFNVEVTVNGGAPSTVSFPNSSNARTSKVISVALNNGNNTIKFRNTSTTLNLRIDRIFCFPGLTGEETTGVLDEATAADTGYTPTALPDAGVDYDTPLSRHNYVPPEDGYESTTGTIAHGGYANYATYKGVSTQLEDPVIQADIDGKYGAGSTPAYRGWAYIRFALFKLTRWGSVMPNITALWENEVYKNCGQIYGQWSTRVGLLTTDFDYSGAVDAKCRGLLVSGRRYAPKDVMAETEDIYDTIFYETEGKIYSILQEDAPEITIAESEIGWGDDDSEDLPSLTTNIENESDTPRRVTLKFIDPDREYEPNTQDEVRLITTGKREDAVDVAITLTAAEARAIAAKKLYRAHTEAVSHNFTLSWKYLYLHPGYIVNTTRNGISLSIQLTQIKGGISILECEGVAVENAVLTQNVTTSGGGVFEKPPVPIPTSSVLTILDLPVLRTADYSINQGGGDYIAVSPRSSTTKAWKAADVYMEEDGEYKPLVRFTSPCVMGTVVGSQTLPDASTFTAAETGYTLDVDFFGSDAALVNATSTQARDGILGLYVIGNEAVGITTATKLSSTPNRWRLSGSFWRGRKGTSAAGTGHVVNERVVLINASVKFIPRSFVEDTDVTRNYKAVTAGQSFDDAAEVEYTWTGASMEAVTAEPSAATITFDGTSLIHQVTLAAGTKYSEIQISSVNDQNTFLTGGNKIWSGKSTKWADSQLSTDPRSATRYFRVLGLWGNWSPIISASYNVVAPSAPTVTKMLPVPATGPQYRIVAAGGYDTRRIKQTVLEAVLDLGGGEVWNDTNPNFRQYPKGGYAQTIQIPKAAYPAGSKIKVRAYFRDAFGDGTAS